MKLLLKTILFIAIAIYCTADMYSQSVMNADNRTIFEKLDDIAIVEEMVMIPMRDGTKLSTTIWRPKSNEKVPTIFAKTPYNFNPWINGSRNARAATEAYNIIQHGYAYIMQNERGRFYSQGEWKHLGAPITDAQDMYDWIRRQSWSNGKIGLWGCSSTAEWQLSAASLSNPADAMVPMGYAAGIGKVGRFYQHGNFFRGGVEQVYKAAYIGNTEQDYFRPQVADNATREDLIRVSKFYDLAPNNPPVSWSKALNYLPIKDILKNIGYKNEMFNRQIVRNPTDKGWFTGANFMDTMDFNVPGFWFVSWYDIGVSEPLEVYNWVRENAATQELRDNQYLVIAPVTHCAFYRSTENTFVGDLSVGDARLNYYDQIYSWFDYFLKDDKKNGFLETTPKVQYYTMGTNEWNSSETWPPAGVKIVDYYLDSKGNANSLHGDGILTTNKPGKVDVFDTFISDPMNPVHTNGGGSCCAGDALFAGAFDQRSVEIRNDVLVYTTEVLKEPINVTGTIETELYLSSDAKDTDISIRLIDVYPDGTAYNIEETIFRARYRKSFEKPEMMEKGQVYKIQMLPMSTSNVFKEGHRIRLEIRGSDFPHFARNLNTGGNNYDESVGVIATNKIHHSSVYPSRIKLPILNK